MSDESKQDIIRELSEHLEDLMIRSHQSKGKELSGLVADLRKDFHALRTDVDSKFREFEYSLEKVQTSITQEMARKHQEYEFTHKDHEKRISTFEKIAWIVVSTLIVAATGAVFVLK